MYASFEHKFMQAYLTQAEEKFNKYKARELHARANIFDKETLNGHSRMDSKT